MTRRNFTEEVDDHADVILYLLDTFGERTVADCIAIGYTPDEKVGTAALQQLVTLGRVTVDEFDNVNLAHKAAK